jgi:hypothetical protein
MTWFVRNLADVFRLITDRLDESSLAEHQFVPKAQPTIFPVVWMLIHG